MIRPYTALSGTKMVVLPLSSVVICLYSWPMAGLLNVVLLLILVVVTVVCTVVAGCAPALELRLIWTGAVMEMLLSIIVRF